jgi:hypothetical protein
MIGTGSAPVAVQFTIEEGGVKRGEFRVTSGTINHRVKDTRYR